MNEIKEYFGEPISTYSREQAIQDGVLVDVSEMAKEAGFKFPTAVTRSVWTDIEKGLNKRSVQSTDGRLWDVLWMASLAARRNQNRFQVRIGRRNHIYKLVAVPGEVTIMQTSED